jgi:predicted MPP superfamily phosphohydrolase
MSEMAGALLILALAAAWVGHACLWTALLNHLYGRPLPKQLLKLWRLGTGAVILAFPLLVGSAINPCSIDPAGGSPVHLNGLGGWAVAAYVAVCLTFGAVVFPAVTVARLLRQTPDAVLSERTETLDLWPELGSKLLGDGKWAWVPRLPLNCVFRVDFTDLTLAIPNLPPAWDGLTILLVSDLHFVGTPSRAYFDRILDRVAAEPPPDLVCLAGDYVDTDRHHAWIGPTLGRLRATEAKLAILGNHDKDYDPGRVRVELAAAGYTVLGNGWRELTVRGVRCVAVGHEGPWFAPGPDLAAAPAGPFRLCLSHTPDNFYWGQASGIGLMLCGHVHGGQVRLPVVGSIFVPSVYGRRFDGGVFEAGGTVMVVGRGLSGKEPLRFRCHPQVIRITLKATRPAGAGRIPLAGPDV